jgi:hypothetical protein
MRVRWGAVVVSAGLILGGMPARGAEGEPDQVVVQHLLIAFGRSIPDRKIERSRPEAKALAESLLARARQGEDFDALVKEFTDDQYPGKLLVTNTGVKPVPGGRTREQLVPRFGDVAFKLAVGEVGIAAHHAALSEYGWHVIKRLE